MRKSILSLVSSTAVLLVAGLTSAQAADPVAAIVAPPEPASAVQVCDTYGAGYFFIPGTETCIKLSGQVAVSVGYDHAYDASYSAVEARMDIDTKADSEFGAIGTKFRLSSRANLDFYTIGLNPVRDEGIELAYITAGPFFAGYKESLVDTDVLYGDALDVGSNFNSTTIGFLADNLGGGLYAGFAAEDRDRNFAGLGGIGGLSGLETRNYDHNSPDLTGRFGVAGQPWGSLDLSGGYATETGDYLVKATADLKAFDKASFRLSAGYVDSDFIGKAYLLSAAGKYDFNDKFAAFTGVSYIHPDNADKTWIANLGGSYALAKDFDVRGEVDYTKYENAGDNYDTKLSFVRSW